MAVVDYEHEHGHTHSLIHFSSLYGFPGALCDQMKACLKQLPTGLKKLPVTEKALFSALQRYLWPECEQIWIDQKWLVRKRLTEKEKEAAAKASLEQNLEHVDGVLDKDDVEKIHAVIKESREHAERKAAEVASKAGVITARGSSIPLAFARGLKPRGPTIVKDDRLHWRWQGVMKNRSTLPKSSRSWRPGGPGDEVITENEALRIVLKTLWKWHAEEDDPEACIVCFEEGWKDEIPYDMLE